MKIVFFYLDAFKELCSIMRKFCEEFDYEYEMIDVDQDPDVLSDYNVKGVPPIFIVFDELGHRKITHKGRFDKSKLDKIFNSID